jgi:hypothetical protein
VIGKRSAAMAFRLEALGDRWLCTALELGAHWRLAMRTEPFDKPRTALVDSRPPAQRGGS